jgi:acetyl-CoA carboxylase carboxyltransferase component
MGVDAAVNAMYAAKLDTLSQAERADFLEARRAEYEADLGLLQVASQLVVDSVVSPEDLRAELVARLAAADGWSRSPARRHHGVFPV